MAPHTESLSNTTANRQLLLATPQDLETLVFMPQNNA